MERGHLTTGITFAFILILMVQCATAGLIERSVEPAGNSTYRVILSMPGETVAGITETVSGGTDFREVTLPPGQYRIDRTTLSLAVIGDREVSYLITVKPGEQGVISGTYINMVTGEEGTLPDGMISGLGSVEMRSTPGKDSSSGDESQAHPTPLSPGLFLIALCAGGLLFSIREREQ